MSTEISTAGIVPVLEPVGCVPILRPARSGPIVGSDPVSMVGDRSLQDVDGAGPAFVVVTPGLGCHLFVAHRPIPLYVQVCAGSQRASPGLVPTRRAWSSVLQRAGYKFGTTGSSGGIHSAAW